MCSIEMNGRDEDKGYYLGRIPPGSGCFVKTSFFHKYWVEALPDGQGFRQWKTNGKEVVRTFGLEEVLAAKYKNRKVDVTAT